MRKIVCLLVSMLLTFLLVGCQSNEQSFVFEDLKIVVEIKVDDSLNVVHDDTGMLITNKESEDSLGIISVSQVQEKSIDEICDLYIIGEGEITKTVISDKLIFVDFLYEIDSAYTGQRVSKMYCFIFYDQDTETVLYGRFFENNDRQDVIDFAKSIKVKKT